MAIASLALGTWFVLEAHATGCLFHDSEVLLSVASHLASGDMSDFYPHLADYASKAPGDLYLSLYPHQSGFLLLLTGISRLFGGKAMVAVQLLSVVASVASSALLCSLQRTMDRSRPERLACIVLTYCFLPPVLLSTLPYGNAIGLVLVLASVRTAVSALRAADGSREALLGLASAALLFLGLAVKATYVYFVFAAVAVGVVKLAHGSRRTRVAILMAASLVAWALSGAIPKAALGRLIGYELPADQPKVTWVAIGLGNGTPEDPRPGWYGAIGTENRIAANGDVEKETSAALGVIRSRLSLATQDPAGALGFVAEKLGYEWLDPTYDCYWTASMLSRPDGSQYIPRDTSTPRGIFCVALGVFMDGMQSLLYLSSAVGALDLARRAGSGRQALGHAFLPCVFLIGFLLYVVWEAKAMYVMPLALCLTPLAARGVAVTLRQRGRG